MLVKFLKELIEIRKELQAIRSHLESSSEKEIHNVVKAINKEAAKTGKSPLIV